MRVPKRDVRNLRVPVDAQGDLQWRFPERQFANEEKDIREPAICGRCHAYLDMNHWHYGEQRYMELKAQPDVRMILCPGCSRVERRLYEGEVVALHGGDLAQRDMMLHLIHNEEARERVENPTARIALMEEHGDEIYILTTTQFLARRIGTELQKAFHGELTINHLRREKFTRIRWRQAKAA
jgi:hypothetical protein